MKAKELAEKLMSNPELDVCIFNHDTGDCLDTEYTDVKIEKQGLFTMNYAGIKVKGWFDMDDGSMEEQWGKPEDTRELWVII